MKNAVLKPQWTISSASAGIIFSVAIFLLCVFVKDLINPYLVMIFMVLSLAVALTLLISKSFNTLKKSQKIFSSKVILFFGLATICAVTLFLVVQNIVKILPFFNP